MVRHVQGTINSWSPCLHYHCGINSSHTALNQKYGWHSKISALLRCDVLSTHIIGNRIMITQLVQKTQYDSNSSTVTARSKSRCSKIRLEITVKWQISCWSPRLSCLQKAAKLSFCGVLFLAFLGPKTGRKGHLLKTHSNRKISQLNINPKKKQSSQIEAIRDLNSQAPRFDLIAGFSRNLHCFYGLCCTAC